ncbi:MAG: beta-N-acetylhexosaminidase [Acidobacteriota bacterium]
MTETPLPLIPWPRQLERRDGSCSLSSSKGYVLDADDDSRARATAALDLLRRGTGLSATTTTEPHALRLRLGPLEDDAADEADHVLDIAADAIMIQANEASGFLAAVQTLRQLLPAELEPAWDDESSDPSPGGALELPCLRIEDGPRFGWRGQHLDVVRHFFGADVVADFLRLAGSYKLNRLHWHLTDDQGWRLPLPGRPLLTEKGGRRRETIVEKNFNPFVGDGVPHEGSYTLDEIRDLVELAGWLGVELVPEIDLPGHATALLVAHPELACGEAPTEVECSWGEFEGVICPSETNVVALTELLAATAELFPGAFLHLGGDEVPRSRWERCSEVASLQEGEGLDGLEQVLSHFIDRLARPLIDRGRTVLAWDEVLEGGPREDLVLCAWRDASRVAAAARAGHRVISCYQQALYFDHYQGPPESEPLAIGGFSNAEKVHGVEPVPEELSSDEQARVIGVQGQLWTEYIATVEHLQVMALPRLLALAEVAWSSKDRPGWSHFEQRLGTHLDRLRRRGFAVHGG